MIYTQENLLPKTADYTMFLTKAVYKFKIDFEEARNKYGKFTYRQWKELLNK